MSNLRIWRPLCCEAQHCLPLTVIFARQRLTAPKKDGFLQVAFFWYLVFPMMGFLRSGSGVAHRQVAVRLQFNHGADNSVIFSRTSTNSQIKAEQV